MSVSFLSLPELRRTPPEIDGHLHPRFEPVAAALRRQLRAYPGGAAVCVYHRGECVVDLWGGSADDAGTPWLRDTMAPSFSTSKGVAATTLHVMADRGLLDYDDRVADHWPEFAQAGKQAITVRHVLSHQSGLYHIRQMIDHARRMLDWDYMIHAIERAEPLHPPGERTGYHGLTFGFLVGELVQRVGGRPFSEMVQEAVSDRLGLDGLYIGAPPHVLHRAAELIWRRPRLQPPRMFFGPTVEPLGDLVASAARGYEQLWRMAGVELDLTSLLDALAPRGINSLDFSANETLSVAIPAANGLFTARSLALMYAALAGGGEIGGVRLLSSETLARATERQRRTSSLRVIPFDMRWRLGYHGVATTRGVPEHAFGHFGFGGSGGWADPSRNLAVALIVNSGMGTPFGDFRIARIGGAVLDSLRD
ncbi:MAG: beta-lactamase family protein [Deltaproteobacteria bacterium]|nr:beta-lactamase family protein [Deltaproteobacteria bacterium]